MDEIAKREPGEVIDILSQHIERTGFDGRVSSTSEAECTVSMVKIPSTDHRILNSFSFSRLFAAWFFQP